MDHVALGRWGEETACAFLQKKGWRIIERNVSFPRGELDIVAMDKKELVIVEVRTRSVGRIMPPEESVGPVKIRRLVRTGFLYIDQVQWSGIWRIDLVGITCHNNMSSYTVKHYSDITNGMMLS